MKKRFLITTALCLALAPVAIAQSEKARAEATIYLPGDIVWKDGPAALPPGVKIAVLEGDPGKEGYYAMRVKYPEGRYQIAPHTHPQTEHVTVISGEFHVGLGEKFDQAVGKAVPVGSYFFMPAGAKHFVWTTGETIIQLNGMGPGGINYVDSADDPRNAKK